MKNQKIIGSILLFSLVATVFTFSVIQVNNKTVETNAQTGLSNKKIGWGVKREKDHKQPDLHTYLTVLDKYNGIGMGNADKKYVYLTFDEGYEAGYTPEILETLKNNNVKAAFFITAHYLNTQTELVKQMVSEGHIVGNHTVNHYSMPDLPDEKVKTEVMNLHTAIYEKTGYEMKYIRPPKGEFSERTIDITNSLGYTTVMWSLAYDDYDEKHQKGEEYAKSKILDNIHPGAVILLHGNSKDNTNVLDHIIKEVRNMGYEFRTLDEFEK